MPESRFELLIIGGGIIGLATAMEARKRFPRLSLLVVEKENSCGIHQSGHNSGVIHSGIYYRPDSIKAKTCVQGAAEMVAFCQEHGIPLKLCGKVVVAIHERELSRLEELYRRGRANGVPDLAMIGAEQLREIEPYARGIRALHVPGTGITDYVAVTKKFAEIVTGNGGEIRTRTEVKGFVHGQGETIVETTTGPIAARVIINCAGLHSDRISRMAGANTDLMIVAFRGEYYEIVPERQHMVKGLIYPVPDPRFPFLGVHFTRRIYGGVEAGPNAVLAFKREGYRRTDFSLTDTVTTLTFPGFWRMARKDWRTGMHEMYRSLSKKAFLSALQKFLPELREDDLQVGGAGVRAQALDRNGALVDDFRFVQTKRMIHVCNVPSPAATASVPIGRRVVDMVATASDLHS